jgi:hypothetical protein
MAAKKARRQTGKRRPRTPKLAEYNPGEHKRRMDVVFDEVESAVAGLSKALRRLKDVMNGDCMVFGPGR